MYLSPSSPLPLSVKTMKVIVFHFILEYFCQINNYQLFYYHLFSVDI